MDDQAAYDGFYWANGPCCAGCDHWSGINSHVGLCSMSAPVNPADRAAMLGVTGFSLAIGAGHVFTLRDHHCGGFRDEFDWSTLPLSYRKSLGTMPAHLLGEREANHGA